VLTCDVLILVKIDICQYSKPVKRQTDPDVLLLQAAADPTRLAILRQLSDSAEVCACDFTACCDVSQPTVSHHLKVLREAGWIEGQRRGTWIFYSLRPQAIARFRELAGGLGPALPITATRVRRLPVLEARA
jgi:ArsR family transcriptional regulator, arsenate/arsenite/antimonite-responsive transcriptional repressor